MRQRMHQALLGLLAAAAAGGLATAAAVVLAMLIPAFSNGVPSPADLVTGAMMAIVMVLILSIYTAIVFAVGLLVVGLPAWAALYRLGFRSRSAAALAGGVLAAVTASALVMAMGGPGSGVVSFGLLMLLPGVAAGWTLHRVAYGRTRPGLA